MLDIRFVRENPEIVKENIKKKFQDAKLPLGTQTDRKRTCNTVFPPIARYLSAGIRENNRNCLI